MAVPVGGTYSEAVVAAPSASSTRKGTTIGLTPRLTLIVFCAALIVGLPSWLRTSVTFRSSTLPSGSKAPSRTLTETLSLSSARPKESKTTGGFL